MWDTRARALKTLQLLPKTQTLLVGPHSIHSFFRQELSSSNDIRYRYSHRGRQPLLLSTTGPSKHNRLAASYITWNWYHSKISIFRFRHFRFDRWLQLEKCLSISTTWDSILVILQRLIISRLYRHYEIATCRKMESIRRFHRVIVSLKSDRYCGA